MASMTRDTPVAIPINTVLTPLLSDKKTCDALDVLAYLTECNDLGRQPSEETELNDFIESLQAFQLEHEPKLITLVAKAIAQLEGWLASPEAKTKTEDVEGQVIIAKVCIRALREAGF
jgi:hypothetical protein